MNVLEQRRAEAVVSIAKTLRSPDWEQRRYEIAKDILPHTILEYYRTRFLNITARVSNAV